MVGRAEASGWSSQRQNPASLGFSDKNLGGRILCLKFIIATACSLEVIKDPRIWKMEKKIIRSVQKKFLYNLILLYFTPQIEEHPKSIHLKTSCKASL